MSTEPSPPGSPSPVNEGDILASKYRVEKVLGVGGMGVVVAAEHIELSQKVALKFLLKQAATNDELVSRFLREARASVRLKGAHVAKTLDVGRLEDGCPYIVMEFLDGHDLHAEIRGAQGHLAIEDVVSYVVQAAEGLAEAHSLGIVHRDLKPGNLFLTRGVDGRPLVKVLDFGISKTMDPLGGDGLSLTRTEMLLGSPLYMSPEQMRSSKHVDERSDLWALGAIAFELLTGRVPFEAETILELCFKVAQEKPPSPKEFRPELPDDLCLAVLRCLEKDPDARFSNVGELASAFEPFALTRDRGTAERALDVLSTGRRKPMRSILPSTTTAVSTPGSGSQPGVALAATSPTPMSAESGGEPVAQAAWGTTQAQIAAKSRKGIAAVAIGVVAIASLAGVIVSRRNTTPAAVGVVGSAGADVEADAGAKTNAIVNAAAPATGVAVVDAAPPPTATPAPPPTATPAPTTTTKPARPAVTSVTTAKSAKPAASASSAAPVPTTDPAGFIKVRE